MAAKGPTKRDFEQREFTSSEETENKESFGQFPFTVTPSVSGAIKEFSSGEVISAADLANAILDQYGHRKEYAEGAFTSLSLQETPTRKTPGEWMQELSVLFDPGKMNEKGMKKPPEFHGRLAIAGLCLLEDLLRRQLEEHGVFDALMKEITPPVETFLTSRGQQLYERRGGAVDRVPIWPDDPIGDPDQDLLGRDYFAEYLANRIDGISPNSGAYPIHLYAPWGAGKSSLLNLLKAKLGEKGEKKEAQWLTVDFNAWRHQHIRQPWWQLMDLIYRDTKHELSFADRSRENAWRFNTGRLPLIFTIIIVIWLLVILQFWLFRELDGASADSDAFTTLAGNLSTIIALIATIGGGVMAVSRSLFFGSTQAAENYVQLTRDPMNEIRSHFEQLVDRIPQRLAVFIDDLDRCQSEYVVRLLEGVQTLFRDAPVVFVVAADRRWLNACYEEVYRELDHNVREAGKPLGTLFLEKAFRSAISLPGIPEELKKEYWQHLLTRKPPDPKAALPEADKAAMEQAKEKARTMMADVKSDEQLQQIARETADLSFLEKRVLRGEAAVRMASPEVLQEIEHSLQPYAGLLDPNPRAMKRLVNTYSANNAINLITQLDIDKHQLILWTILSNHWPQLADLLIEHREFFLNGSSNGEALPAELRDFLKQPEVGLVINGGPKEESLAPETLEKCARLRA